MHAARRRRPRSIVLGAALLAAAACSESTAPNAELTAEEARELAAQIGVHLFGQAGGLTSSASRSSALTGDASFSAIPAPFHFSFEADAPCPRGGSAHLTVTLSGTFDDATELLIADVTGTHRPKNCGLEAHGKTFRTTGSFTFTAHFEAKDDLPVGTHTATLVGEFEWRATDGRRGKCAVNFTASANYTTKVATANGNFCGSTIQFTGPLTTE